MLNKKKSRFLSQQKKMKYTKFSFKLFSLHANSLIKDQLVLKQLLCMIQSILMLDHVKGR